ncbi:hypothetical protein SAMN05216419_100195 [Nitrosomonas cryotolerans]|uniref:Cytochrome C n=1 Tax=Nitrosomonas cryotolerans ATCC 49181 TaxID=1131553 RepID=A0A1N6IPW8_9PROT|nr:hypothetical protein [Nitrosomonas cryotolerans]SFP35157.1 hypothetical protein SAMN05216419_100195 [Nitrosomonas cryotolerans]SIO33984.1 hypothetical protein SAMN02743940_1970 [Nitrosomonas cryotolerans ATCC 49181]
MNKAFLFFFGWIAATVFAEDLDQRQSLVMTELQRDHIRKEMRALLSGTQNILAALSENDMAAVVQHARPLGMNMTHKAEGHLKEILPKEFMKLGMSIHQDFDQMASDAESLKDSKHTLRQLSDSMRKCVACHSSYQIRTTVQQPTSNHLPGHHRDDEHHK